MPVVHVSIHRPVFRVLKAFLPPLAFLGHEAVSIHRPVFRVLKVRIPGSHNRLLRGLNTSTRV